MEILLFAILIAAIWLWWSSARTRESAVLLAARACRECGVQLLDETVNLTRLRLRRNQHGHIAIARWYTFEFSTSGDNRRCGEIEMLGQVLMTMHLDVNREELPQSQNR